MLSQSDQITKDIVNIQQKGGTRERTGGLGKGTKKKQVNQRGVLKETNTPRRTKKMLNFRTKIPIKE